MSSNDTPEQGVSYPWPPSRHALSLTKWVDPVDAAPTSVVLSHPTAPFVRNVAGALEEERIQEIALEYLARTDEFLIDTADSEGLGLPGSWLRDLKSKRSSSSFGWMPFDPQLSVPAGDEPGRDPSQGSFRVERAAADGKTNLTLILAASERLEPELFLGSEFGLCVVMHVTDVDASHTIRITGMSASGPFGVFRTDGVSSGRVGKKQLAAVLPYLRQSKAEIASALQLREDTVFYRGVRVAAPPDTAEILLEVRGSGVNDLGQVSIEPITFGFVAVVRRSKQNETISISQLSKIRLGTGASPGSARVFHQDPASSRLGTEIWRLRRPTRSDAILDAFREQLGICDSEECDLKTDDVTIEPCPRFVRADKGMASPKTVPLPGTAFPPVCSNDFSAVSAYHYAGQLFDRMRRYGIEPCDYFRVSRLPVNVYYRSGIQPGPGKDGQAVNARVTAKGWSDDFFGPPKPGDRPIIDVHLALGSLSHRARGRWTGTQRAWTGLMGSEVEPLGIASDRRWMWHEFGHVLLMATFGELEFRFAHSPGDALAAIVADPYSRLSDRKTLENKFWGSTFPWVFLPRRHDRCVLSGWSWGGSMHREVAGLPEPKGRRFKGYRSEQILSTTLFRLYRSLGGDTMRDNSGEDLPDQDVRESASHYAVYLIMRALQMRCTPPTRAEELAQALVLADTGTDNPFVVTLESGNTAKRIGGCAHKVIRWAFEAQGMYAADPAVIRNAPGEPEEVDIYIDDNRPKGEATQAGTVTYATPGYVPVSLDWGNEPGWHATREAIRIVDGGFVVTVKNRGRSTAENVTVRVWWRAFPSDPENLRWDAGSGWTESSTPSAPSQDVPAGGAIDFGPFTPVPTAAGNYLVFAQATCADDRANSDPASGLPCSGQPTPLLDLVAGDNNLGLRIIQVS